MQTRLFDNLEMLDQYSGKHLLPFFLSKITNPDQSILKFDEDGNPIRGLRTFAELAHYVRCIPYKDHETYAANQIWCTPDFLMTRLIGCEDDHALLMASLFRTVKHEDLSDFNKWKTQVRKETVLRRDREEKLLRLDDSTAERPDRLASGFDDEDDDDTADHEPTSGTKL